MRSSKLFALAALATLTAAAQAGDGSVRTLVQFNGAIGVDPLTAANGADTSNVVRGINPGGRAWTLRKLSASVGTDGTIVARGAGLLFTSGDLIGTRGGVTHVAASLFCGPANNTATQFVSGAFPLDTFGNFRIRGPLLEPGSTNAAVMPASCDNPVLLIRSANATTGAPGNWFAAGIPGSDDD